jgi:Chaperone of endosialidase
VHTHPHFLREFALKHLRSCILVTLVTLLATAESLAAQPNAGTDPLAAIDRNRNAIIADIVRGFDGDRNVLAQRLAGLRADRLLSASLASTRESLESILNEADKSRTAATRRAGAKLLGSANSELVYTPITPCRLIDTRGSGAPIQGGPFAADERRAYSPNGACGLPMSGVATMLISFTTLNLTPNSGGYLAIVGPGAAVLTTVDVFNIGTSWSGSNTAVATGGAAQFDIFVSTANSEVVVDVLGYFSPALIDNITLVDSTASTGNILKGADRFIHNAGTNNTFVGVNSGNFTMTGDSNAALGSNALTNNATGSSNTAEGVNALESNSTGDRNTATGFAALQNNFSGTGNTAIGVLALRGNANGSYNVAIGNEALTSSSTGDGNIAIGAGAGFNQINGNNNVFIGHPGVLAENNTIRIGLPANYTRAFIAGVRGSTTDMADAIPVYIDSNGQLGTASSSRRFKNDIADMDASSSALMKLRPVTFHYKTDRSASARTQYGLIAEEVDQVYPGLVAHSADGQVETVMYQFLPSMLLNEYQKQQRVIEAQMERIDALEKVVGKLVRERPSPVNIVRQ